MKNIWGDEIEVSGAESVNEWGDPIHIEQPGVQHSSITKAIFPSATQTFDSVYGQPATPWQTVKDVGNIALHGAGDLLGLTARIPAKVFGGQPLSDPSSNLMRDRAAQAGQNAQEALNQAPEGFDPLKAYGGVPSMGGMPYMPAVPAMAPGLAQAGGLQLGDAATYLGAPGLSKGLEVANPVSLFRGAVTKASPTVKKLVSELAQTDPTILEKAATVEGLREIVKGAKVNRQALAEDIANTAEKVNNSRAQAVNDINARNALENQGLNERARIEAQQANDRAALENQSVNAQYQSQAEQQNAQRQALFNESQKTRQQQAAGSVLEARNKAIGGDASGLSDIKPGQTGEALNSAMADARKIQLDQWQQGNKEAFGPLSNAPSAKVVKRIDDGTFRAKRVLTQNFASTLGKYKALSDNQGMRSISSGAQGAGKYLIGYSEKNGHTLDDLVNIKREIERVKTQGSFNGVPFDNTNDQRFFGDMHRSVDNAIIETVKKAAPKDDGKIIGISKAMSRQYEKTTRMLGEYSRGANQVKSSTDIIGQVAALGPEKARTLIQESLNNPAIASVVPKMRQAFVDELLTSAMENGDVNFSKLSARWNSPKMQELKQAWLSPEQIANFDEGIRLGTALIEKPGIVKPNAVPLPDKIYPYKIPAPEQIPIPEKIGGRLLQNGKANVPVIKEKLGTMAGNRPGNENDLASLQALDKIAGTNYSEQVRPIYEALQLGMDESGNMSSISKSNTGRSGLSAHIGKVAGALIGGPMGFIAGHGVGAGEGTLLGGFAGDIIQSGVMYAGSPAGAVKAYKLVNKIVEARYPRSAKIGKLIQWAQSPVRKAALINSLYRTLEEESGVKIDRGVK